MNGMYCFYLIALIPALIGLALMLFNRRINIVEWATASVVGFITAGIMHLCAYTGMTSDTEIWSGQVTQVTKHPFWVETYQEAIYVTRLEPVTHWNNGKMSVSLENRRRFSHYETRYRDHHQYFTKDVSFGVQGQNYKINESEYNDVVGKFGGVVNTVPSRPSGFYSGDPNVYTCNNKTGYVLPATMVKTWSNKVKASPSSFSFPKVPKDAPLFEYPSCLDTWHSDRLLGDAGVKIDSFVFDQLNAKLGPRKKVNIIIVGFSNADANLGKLQEAKWVGGKKNDVVICYGYAPLEGNIPNVCWTYCFSWCKNDQMKRNIEQLFLNNTIDNTILTKLEEEIVKGYQKREWSEFDNLSVKPRPVHYWWLIGIMLVVQIGFYVVAWVNDFNDDDV
jgi:hypothetical protein